VDVHLGDTVLALHTAAPHELAVASLHELHRLGGVAPAAAEEGAGVGAGGGGVALTPGGAKDALLGAALAVVGRVVDVHQLRLARRHAHLPAALGALPPRARASQA